MERLSSEALDEAPIDIDKANKHTNFVLTSALVRSDSEPSIKSHPLGVVFRESFIKSSPSEIVHRESSIENP